MSPLNRQSTIANRKAPAAFTLVELLVVVAIIVLLLAMLLPSLNRSIETARLAACASNQHQQHVADMSYSADNYGLIPGMTNDPGFGWTNQAVNHWPRWFSTADYPSPTPTAWWNQGFLWREQYIKKGGIF